MAHDGVETARGCAWAGLKKVSMRRIAAGRIFFGIDGMRVGLRKAYGGGWVREPGVARCVSQWIGRAKG